MLSAVAGTAVAQLETTTTPGVPLTTPAVSTPSVGWLTQPYATVITGGLAVVIALIALAGVR
ncbi:hypothetical protein AB0E01_25905 [Nocardia vinacea]|uniref:hypothetical protein n=1 Tax=Nocardia vinacea TaxID=96468 RepID=UPI0033E803DA